MSEVQIEERLGRIREQVDQLKAVMDDMLLLARMQARRAEFNPVLLDVDGLCQEIIDEFKSHPDSQHTFNYSFEGDAKHARLDQKLMRQTISNLVSNAVKYSPPERPVRIQLKAVVGMVTLTVSDEGIGIPKNDLAHLFEPFHRASNVGAVSGTGLGLVITKEAVELHGGTVDVQSQVGVGTIFVVTLPLTSE